MKSVDASLSVDLLCTYRAEQDRDAAEVAAGDGDDRGQTGRRRRLKGTDPVYTLDLRSTVAAQMAALHAAAGPERYAMLSAVLDPAVGVKLGRFLETGVGL